MYDLSELAKLIFTPQNILIYLVIINLLAFFAMWWDKRRAQKGEWRISEAGLFTLVILGGGIGGIAGMYIFRHKTKKLKFTIGFPTILITEIILAIYFCLLFPNNGNQCNNPYLLFDIVFSLFFLISCC